MKNIFDEQTPSGVKTLFSIYSPAMTGGGVAPVFIPFSGFYPLSGVVVVGSVVEVVHIRGAARLGAESAADVLRVDG